MIVVPLPDRGISWKRTPWLWAIIGANTLVMAVALLRGDTESFILGGALDPEKLKPLAFLSSMFLHASIGHLVGNMLFLWGVGQPLYHRLGAAKFLAAYLLTGIAGGMAHAAFSPEHPVVGASGAISGLMGLFATLWPKRRMRLAYWIGKGGLLRPRAYWALGLWILLQVVFARMDDGSDSVAYSAHIGGFAAGAVLGLLLRLRLPQGREREWILETPEPGQEVHAVHLARAVTHNSRIGETEAMGRAWDEWDSGGAHVGFTSVELGRLQGDFQRRGDLVRASHAGAWKRLLA